MQGVAHGSEPLGTGAGASGQGLPRVRYTNVTHVTEPAVSARRHGAGWDLGRRDEKTPACPNGQAKYYSSKLIQPVFGIGL